MRRSLGPAALLFGFLSCDDGDPPPSERASACWSAVTICDHAFGPFYEALASHRAGCDTVFTTGLADESRRLTCVDWHCFGDFDAFDLRSEGVDAFGRTRIEVNRMAASSRFECMGVDCADVLAREAAPICQGLVPLSQGTITPDTGLPDGQSCDAATPGPRDYWLVVDEFSAECGADGWDFSFTTSAPGALRLSLTDGTRRERHRVGYSVGALNFTLPIGGYVPDVSTAFACADLGRMGFQVDLYDDAMTLTDCVVWSGTGYSAAQFFGDDWGGCSNADRW